MKIHTQWRRHVETWRESGLSQADYCRQQGFSIYTKGRTHERTRTASYLACSRSLMRPPHLVRYKFENSDSVNYACLDNDLLARWKSNMTQEKLGKNSLIH